MSVDEKGYANEGHTFVQIDATNFYVDDIKYTADKGELTVTGYYEALFRGEAKIITALDFQGRHMMVRKIGNNAFYGCDVLTGIMIPNSVTSIGRYAFEGCSGLTSITIGNSVTNIGVYAFKSCSSLTSITIPESVTSIADYAFEGCSGLTSITILNSVTSIGYSAFLGCSGLKDVYCYAEQVPSTDSYAFHNVPLSSVTLHVPEASIDAYKAESPWSKFGNIVALTDNDPKP